VASGVIYWVDRCLGTNIVPAALGAIGVRVETYESLYPNDPRVPDHVWIPEGAHRGWVILTKDKRIRHAPVCCRDRWKTGSHPNSQTS